MAKILTTLNVLSRLAKNSWKWNGTASLWLKIEELKNSELEENPSLDQLKKEKGSLLKFITQTLLNSLIKSPPMVLTVERIATKLGLVGSSQVINKVKIYI
jgi:hypothetical protein